MGKNALPARYYRNMERHGGGGDGDDKVAVALAPFLDVANALDTASLEQRLGLSRRGDLPAARLSSVEGDDDDMSIAVGNKGGAAGADPKIKPPSLAEVVAFFWCVARRAPFVLFTVCSASMRRRPLDRR